MISAQVLTTAADPEHVPGLPPFRSVAGSLDRDLHFADFGLPSSQLEAWLSAVVNRAGPQLDVLRTEISALRSDLGLPPVTARTLVDSSYIPDDTLFMISSPTKSASPRRDHPQTTLSDDDDDQSNDQDDSDDDDQCNDQEDDKEASKSPRPPGEANNAEEKRTKITPRLYKEYHTGNLSKLGLDRQTLGALGLDKATVDETYRSLYVHSVGAHTLIRRACVGVAPRFRGRFASALWLVFLHLVEATEDVQYQSVLTRVKQAGDKRAEAIAKENETAIVEAETAQRYFQRQLKAAHVAAEAMARDAVTAKIEFDQVRQDHQDTHEASQKQIRKLHAAKDEWETSSLRHENIAASTAAEAARNAAEFTKSAASLTSTRRSLEETRDSVRRLTQERDAALYESQAATDQCNVLNATVLELGVEVDDAAERLKTQSETLTAQLQEEQAARQRAEARLLDLEAELQRVFDDVQSRRKENDDDVEPPSLEHPVLRDLAREVQVMDCEMRLLRHKVASIPEKPEVKDGTTSPIPLPSPPSTPESSEPSEDPVESLPDDDDVKEEEEETSSTRSETVSDEPTPTSNNYTSEPTEGPSEEEATTFEPSEEATMTAEPMIQEQLIKEEQLIIQEPLEEAPIVKEDAPIIQEPLEEAPIVKEDAPIIKEEPPIQEEDPIQNTEEPTMVTSEVDASVILERAAPAPPIIYAEEEENRVAVSASLSEAPVVSIEEPVIVIEETRAPPLVVRKPIPEDVVEVRPKSAPHHPHHHVRHHHHHHHHHHKHDAQHQKDKADIGAAQAAQTMWLGGYLKAVGSARLYKAEAERLEGRVLELERLVFSEISAYLPEVGTTTPEDDVFDRGDHEKDDDDAAVEESPGVPSPPHNEERSPQKRKVIGDHVVVISKLRANNAALHKTAVHLGEALERARDMANDARKAVLESHKEQNDLKDEVAALRKDSEIKEAEHHAALRKAKMSCHEANCRASKLMFANGAMKDRLQKVLDVDLAMADARAAACSDLLLIVVSSARKVLDMHDLCRVQDAEDWRRRGIPQSTDRTPVFNAVQLEYTIGPGDSIVKVSERRRESAMLLATAGSIDVTSRRMSVGAGTTPWPTEVSVLGGMDQAIDTEVLRPPLNLNMNGVALESAFANFQDDVIMDHVFTGTQLEAPLERLPDVLLRTSLTTPTTTEPRRGRGSRTRALPSAGSEILAEGLAVAAACHERHPEAAAVPGVTAAMQMIVHLSRALATTQRESQSDAEYRDFLCRQIVEYQARTKTLETRCETLVAAGKRAEVEHKTAVAAKDAHRKKLVVNARKLKLACDAEVQKLQGNVDAANQRVHEADERSQQVLEYAKMTYADAESRDLRRWELAVFIDVETHITNAVDSAETTVNAIEEVHHKDALVEKQKANDDAETQESTSVQTTATTTTAAKEPTKKPATTTKTKRKKSNTMLASQKTENDDESQDGSVGSNFPYKYLGHKSQQDDDAGSVMSASSMASTQSQARRRRRRSSITSSRGYRPATRESTKKRKSFVEKKQQDAPVILEASATNADDTASAPAPSVDGGREEEKVGETDEAVAETKTTEEERSEPSPDVIIIRGKMERRVDPKANGEWVQQRASASLTTLWLSKQQMAMLSVQETCGKLTTLFEAIRTRYLNSHARAQKLSGVLDRMTIAYNDLQAALQEQIRVNQTTSEELAVKTMADIEKEKEKDDFGHDEATQTMETLVRMRQVQTDLSWVHGCLQNFQSVKIDRRVRQDELNWLDTSEHIRVPNGALVRLRDFHGQLLQDHDGVSGVTVVARHAGTTTTDDLLLGSSIILEKSKPPAPDHAPQATPQEATTSTTPAAPEKVEPAPPPKDDRAAHQIPGIGAELHNILKDTLAAADAGLRHRAAREDRLELPDEEPVDDQRHLTFFERKEKELEEQKAVEKTMFEMQRKSSLASSSGNGKSPEDLLESLRNHVTSQAMATGEQLPKHILDALKALGDYQAQRDSAAGTQSEIRSTEKNEEDDDDDDETGGTQTTAASNNEKICPPPSMSEMAQLEDLVAELRTEDDTSGSSTTKEEEPPEELPEELTAAVLKALRLKKDPFTAMAKLKLKQKLDPKLSETLKVACGSGDAVEGAKRKLLGRLKTQFIKARARRDDVVVSSLKTMITDGGGQDDDDDDDDSQPVEAGGPGGGTAAAPRRKQWNMTKAVFPGALVEVAKSAVHGGEEPIAAMQAWFEDNDDDNTDPGVAFLQKMVAIASSPRKDPETRARVRRSVLKRLVDLIHTDDDDHGSSSQGYLAREHVKERQYLNVLHLKHDVEGDLAEQYRRSSMDVTWRVPSVPQPSVPGGGDDAPDDDAPDTKSTVTFALQD